MKEISGFLNHYLQNPEFRGKYKETLDYIFNHPHVQNFIKANQGQLTQEIIDNSFSKLNEFVREIDLIEAGEQGQNPGFQPKLFLNHNYIDVTYEPTDQYFAQEERKQRQHLLDNRMMSAEVRHASLQEFTLDTLDRKNLMAAVMYFLDEYEKDPHNSQGLFITGSFGVGKTYLLGALANYLVNKKKSVTMIHLPTFITDLKASFKDNTTHQLIDKVKIVDVLMVDDIGAEMNTEWSRDEVLTPILEYRMKESLPTFFSSNFNFEQLEKHLSNSKDGREERVKGKRTMERIKYLAREIELKGKNLRHQRRGK